MQRAAGTRYTFIPIWRSMSYGPDQTKAGQDAIAAADCELDVRKYARTHACNAETTTPARVM